MRSAPFSFWLILGLGAEKAHPANIPVGSRFRRESLQIATKLLEKHSRVPHVRFHDSDTIIEGVPPPAPKAPLKRSASPVIFEDDDDFDLDMETSQVGVLGFILDLYKLQRDDYLDAIEESESLSRERTSSISNREASQESSQPESIEAKRRKHDYERIGSGSTLNDESKGDTSSFSPINTVFAMGSQDSDLYRQGRRKRRKPMSRERQSKRDDNQTLTQIGMAIRMHILRQLYIVKLCRALMQYGAPTHRLEA